MPINTALSKAGPLSPADPKTVRITVEQSASIVARNPGRGVPVSVLPPEMRSRLSHSDLTESLKSFMLAADTTHRGVPGSVLLAAMRTGLTRSELSKCFKAFMLAPENHEAMSRVINATLTQEELLEAFKAPNRARLVIGATYSPKTASLTLYTAAFERIEVPVSWFKARPASPPVELSRLAVGDYGQTLLLGEFEVCVDALLDDFGPGA